MEAVLASILFITSLVIILISALRPNEEEDLSAALIGASDGLFSTVKERGIDLFFRRLMYVLLTVFLVVSLVYVITV